MQRTVSVKDTSLSAYRAMRAGRGPTALMWTLEYIRHHPCCTQYEVSLDLGETARKRISGLLGPNEGDVMECSYKRIGPSGRQYTQYRVREAADVAGLTLGGPGGDV